MKKILLVDDDPDFVKMIKIRLEANNYSVVAVSDAKEVLQTAEKEIPDIILLDIVMPNIDGYRICERLRQGKRTEDLPIIFLTGKELVPAGINQRCLKLGVEGFLLKPFDAKKLIAKIEEVLKEK